MASDPEAVRECWLNLLKEQLIFVKHRPNFKTYSFGKKNSVMEFFTQGTQSQGTPQAVRWPCKLIIVSIGYFLGPTEVQLNSWCPHKKINRCLTNISQF